MLFRSDGETLGEITVRGNVVMAGYYNDARATETALRGGWFHSGDAAVVHPDGYIEIRDRFKDVIISGGAESGTSPLTFATLARMGALSERNDDPGRASRPWDRDRDGFVMADGAGALAFYLAMCEEMGLGRPPVLVD